MKLVPVSFEKLSDITYSIALAPHEKHSIPEFLVVKFTGKYRDGSSGRTDAIFLVAIMEAVQKAWFSAALIIDFTDLSYHWGDEMDWIHEVGRFHPSPCHKPMAIIVGDQCRTALKSLAPEEYDQHCVESLDDAVALIRSRKPDFDLCMEEWRRNPKGNSTTP
jgi:hypothetical protein